jgi:hypothetical protein
VNDTDPEIEFLRSVEDLFATLRGVPHLLSPKDMQLARTWWKDEVPLAAVTAGVTEVMEKRRAADDGDPVVSLSYCRHAVRRHTKRLKEQHVGAHSEAADPRDTDRLIKALAADLRKAADRADFPETADAIEAFAVQVYALIGAAPGLVDEQLFALETGLLEACRRTLPPAILGEIEQSTEAKAGASGPSSDALKRSRRAVLDRRIRTLLDLPRLEIQ